MSKSLFSFQYIFFQHDDVFRNRERSGLINGEETGAKLKILV